MSRNIAPAPIFNYRKRQRVAVFADPEIRPNDKLDRLPPVFPQNDLNVLQLSSPKFLDVKWNTEGALNKGERLPCASTNKSVIPSVKESSRQGAESAGQNCRKRAPSSATSQHSGWNGVCSTGDMNILPFHPTHASSGSLMSHPESAKERISRSLPQSSCTMISFTKFMPEKNQANRGIAKKPATLPDRSVRVLTLPIAQLKRLFRLSFDNMPSFIFILTGVMDSAVVSDNATSGKSFILRDETDSVECIFCEIDRQMPRLHRGQWYRVVGVIPPTRELLQCLSIRLLSTEEQHAAHTMKSHCMAVLNDLLRGIVEQ